MTSFGDLFFCSLFPSPCPSPPQYLLLLCQRSPSNSAGLRGTPLYLAVPSHLAPTLSPPAPAPEAAAAAESSRRAQLPALPVLSISSHLLAEPTASSEQASFFKVPVSHNHLPNRVNDRARTRALPVLLKQEECSAFPSGGQRAGGCFGQLPLGAEMGPGTRDPSAAASSETHS